MSGPGSGKFLLYFCLAAVDVGLNGAAGAAAVTAGANIEGAVVTDRETGMGAIVGFLKAGIIAFVGISGFVNLNCFSSLFLGVIGSSFIVALLCMVQAWYLLSGELPPKELLVAAVVATLPLMNEGISMYFATENYFRQNAQGEIEENFSLGSLFWMPWIVAWDALGGYTFARMAQNQGMPLCEMKSAAAAGAAFGGVALIPKLIAYVAWALMHAKDFGS